MTYVEIDDIPANIVEPELPDGRINNIDEAGAVADYLLTLALSLIMMTENRIRSATSVGDTTVLAQLRALCATTSLNDFQRGGIVAAFLASCGLSAATRKMRWAQDLLADWMNRSTPQATPTVLH